MTLHERAAAEPAAPNGEVRMTDPNTGGQKGRKAERYELIPREPLAALARVYGFGAKKYTDTNYLLGYPWGLSIGAAQRHFDAWILGESIDPESGENHLLHLAWHAFTLYLFERYGLGTDDRLEVALGRGADMGEPLDNHRSDANLHVEVTMSASVVDFAEADSEELADFIAEDARKRALEMIRERRGE